LGASLCLPSFPTRRSSDLQVEQPFATGADVADPALLLIIQRLTGEEHLAEAEDAVERRPQFVAHRRQEVALETVRLVQGQVGLRSEEHTSELQSLAYLVCR